MTDDHEASAARRSGRAGLAYAGGLLVVLAAIVTLLSIDAGDDKTVDRLLAVILVGAIVAAIASLRR